MQLVSTTVLLAALLSVVIGTFILIKSPRRGINQAFFVFSFGTGLWNGAFGLIVLTQDDIFLPILNIGGLILVAGLTRFAQIFPTPKPLPVRPALFWLPLFLGGISLILSNSIIQHVSILQGEMHIVHGSLMNVWSLLLLSYVLMSFWFLLGSYAAATTIDKERLWLVYAGIIIFVFCSITFDAILPGLFGLICLNFLGPICSLIMVFATAYAIIKHEFLDIRIVIQRSLVYSLSLFLLASFYVILLLVIDYFIQGLFNVMAPVLAGVTILIGMYTLPYMQARFRRITDPIFFKDNYSYSDVLEELSTVLNTRLDLQSIILETLSVLEQALKPTYIHFLHVGSLEQFLPTALDLEKMDCVPEAKSIRISIRSISSEIGEYVLGPKRSGDLYTPQDYSLLRTFGSNATIAFEKAELHQDILEHARMLEIKVDERTRHLHKLQAHQREFFDDISHALQTPLTVLKSSLEVLRPVVNLSGNEVYSSMRKSVDDLSGLTHSILELARIDTQSPDTREETINLSLLVAGISEYVTVIAKSKHISVITDIVPLIFARGNARQLEEAITNILSNAVKYTSNSPTREIRVVLTSIHTEIFLSIKDSGIGMEEHELARIFERFYRANKSKGGYGLGLAITKRIIERHGGQIRIEGRMGDGTAVYIKLPCVMQEAIQS